jgi:hypothetical protein
VPTSSSDDDRSPEVAPVVVPGDAVRARVVGTDGVDLLAVPLATSRGGRHGDPGVRAAELARVGASVKVPVG